MADRRDNLNLTVGDHVIGCPLCMYDDLAIEDMLSEEKATAEDTSASQ